VPRPPRPTLHAPGHLVEVGSERLHVRRTGTPDAVPAVMIHGLGGSSRDWAELAYELADEADVHVVDLPGHGRSPVASTGRHDLATHADALIAYLEQIGPSHLVGNSMGGLLAVLVAGRRPDLVRSLSLVSPAMPHWVVPPSARLISLLSLPVVGRRLLQTAYKSPLEQQIDYGVHDLFGTPSRATEDLREDWIAERRTRIQQPHVSQVFVQAARSIIAEAMHPPRAWRAVRHYPGPTLVILGLRDRLVHHSVGSAWERRVPRARVVRMPTTGHVAQMEQPELVASMVSAMWSQALDPSHSPGPLQSPR
jgi:pimeloyl-ACP methyl ester carboxylesterase